MRKYLLFWSLAALLTLAATEGIARLGYSWIPESDGLYVEPAYSGKLSQAQREVVRSQILGNKTEYTDYSTKLGWTIKPHGRSTLYYANSQGIRADREYALQPDSSVVRIAAFGDSYTHGDDVANKDTWESHLEDRNPKLEVLNFGVGGYGTDQALLRYEHEGVLFHPHIAMLGFRPENIGRVVSVFRPFYYPRTGLIMSKPRFEIRDGKLVLLPNPIPSREAYGALLTDPARVLNRLGQHDYHYNRSYHYWWGDRITTVKVMRMLAHHAALEWKDSDRIEFDGRFNPDSEAFKILIEVFLRFRDVALKSGSRPIVLILPDKVDVDTYRARESKIYEPLLSALKDHAIEHIDLMDAFAKYGKDQPSAALFSGHYNSLGNNILARYIDDYLIAHGLVDSSLAPVERADRP